MWKVLLQWITTSHQTPLRMCSLLELCWYFENNHYNFLQFKAKSFIYRQLVRLSQRASILWALIALLVLMLCSCFLWRTSQISSQTNSHIWAEENRWGKQWLAAAVTWRCRRAGAVGQDQSSQGLQAFSSFLRPSRCAQERVKSFLIT